MTKAERLQQAYKDLQSGKIIEFIPDEGKRMLPHGCKCWIGESSNPNCKYKLIFWEHFGSSANRMSLSDLRWIAKVIGHCTTYQYKTVNSIYSN